MILRLDGRSGDEAKDNSREGNKETLNKGDWMGLRARRMRHVFICLILEVKNRGGGGGANNCKLM